MHCFSLFTFCCLASTPLFALRGHTEVELPCFLWWSWQTSGISFWRGGGVWYQQSNLFCYQWQIAFDSWNLFLMGLPAFWWGLDFSGLEFTSRLEIFSPGGTSGFREWILNRAARSSTITWELPTLNPLFPAAAQQGSKGVIQCCANAITSIKVWWILNCCSAMMISLLDHAVSDIMSLNQVDCSPFSVPLNVSLSWQLYYIPVELPSLHQHHPPHLQIFRNFQSHCW